MFCGKCGAENDDSAKVCKACGSTLTNEASQKGNASEEAKANASKFIEKFNALPKNAKIGGIAGIVVLVLLICIGVNTGKTINLDKYVTVETTGYDGFGHATVSVDWDAIESKYGSKLKYTSYAKKEYGNLLNLATPVELLDEEVSVSLDKKDNLSNGDEITYTWNIDDELNDVLNCKVKYKDTTIKVSDLEKVDTFDAFSNLEVSFEGVGPNGTVNLNYTGSELSAYDFSCDPINGLSNGDKVVISINEGNIESLAQSIGKIPAESSKEYVVDGLQSYLTKASDLNEDTLNAFVSQGEDAFNAYVAQNWSEDTASLVSLEYIGNYLLTIKSDNAYGNNNKLFLIYKATADNHYESYQQTNYDYWYIEYDNIVVDSDGNSDKDVTDYSTTYNAFDIDSGVSSGWFGTYTWRYRGYETLNSLYKDVVTSNIENYNYEDNVNDTESTVETEDSNEESGAEDEADEDTSADEETQE